jgi:hypothetical protein
MAFMGMLRVLSLSPETPRAKSRKISILLRPTSRIMRVFHSGERRLPACSRQRLATTCSLPRAAKGVADGVDVSELEMSLSSD